MDVIAITGGIATGKSTVAQMFAKQHQIAVIDSDHIAKSLTDPNSPVFKQIISKFGNVILNSDRTINRKALRELIFNNSEYKNWLEQLLHPLINKQIRENIALLKQDPTYTKNYCLVLIPLLDKKYLQNNLFINKIIIITADERLQLARATNRDSQSSAQIQKIIEQQMSENERLKLSQFFDCEIINNNGDVSDLSFIVDQLNLKFAQHPRHTTNK